MSSQITNKPALAKLWRWLFASSRVRALVGPSAIIGIFLVAGSILPLHSPPVVDEPIYAKSAFEWARTGNIRISELSYPIAVFDTVWGGQFVRVLGPTHEALRWSTITLTALSSLFFYWLLLQVGAARRLALLGMALYLFNPLAFVLSVTFMNDMHSTALITISVAFLVRAFRNSQIDWKWLAFTGITSSIGFLSRQVLLVVPIAGVIAISIEARAIRSWSRSVLALTWAPIVVYLLYGVWTSKDVEPFIRTLSEETLAARFVSEMGHFLGMATIMTIVYAGIVSLPLAPLLPRIGLLRAGRPLPVVLPIGAALVGTIALASGRDPTSGQIWAGRTGLGGIDGSYAGARPWLWSDLVQSVLILTATLVAAALIRAVATKWPPGRVQTRTLLLLLMGGFVATAILASMMVAVGIFDRYWAPLIPLTIALVVGVARVSRVRFTVATGAVVIVGLLGWLGTYDALVANQEIVAFANEAIESGIDPLLLDGGASWSALTFGVADDDGPEHILMGTGPYWMRFYAVHTEPQYWITLEVPDGHRILDRREFPSILHIKPTYAYLVERTYETDP